MQRLYTKPRQAKKWQQAPKQSPKRQRGNKQQKTTKQKQSCKQPKTDRPKPKRAKASKGKGACNFLHFKTLQATYKGKKGATLYKHPKGKNKATGGKQKPQNVKGLQVPSKTRDKRACPI